MPASRPAPGSFEALLTDPYVVAAIHRRLSRYGFRSAATPDRDDGCQDVTTKAFEWKGERPTTKEGVARLCVCIAHRHGASHYRKEKRDQKRGKAELTDAADEHPLPTDLRFDVIDFRRLCEALDLTVPDHLADAFEDILQGVPQSEAFESRGIPAKKGRKLLAKWRLRSRESLAMAGLGVLLAAGAYLLFFNRPAAGPEQPEAHPTPSAAPSQVVVDNGPTAAPSDSVTPPPSPEKLAQAAALRQKALADADAGAWDDTVKDLVQAWELDPDYGRASPCNDVQDKAEAQREAKVLPRTPLKPPPASSKPTKPAGPTP